jgi:hypothetical protein
MPTLAAQPVEIEIPDFLQALFGGPQFVVEVLDEEGETVATAAQRYATNTPDATAWGLDGEVNAATIAAWRADPEHFTAGKIVVSFESTGELEVNGNSLIANSDEDVATVIGGLPIGASVKATTYRPDGSVETSEHEGTYDLDAEVLSDLED